MADDVWEEDEPDRSKKVWGYVGVGVLCVALLVGAIFLTMKLTRTSAAIPQVGVPQVQGLTKAAAERAITDAGLILGPETPHDSTTVPSGTVISQNPSVGTPIDKGKPVSLVLSTGISLVTVPNLTGLSPTDAQAQLTNLNLKLVQTQQYSTDAQKNTVISQTPKTNTSVKPGSTVNVVVGKGFSYTVVPKDLVGKSYLQAVAELTKAGLKAIKTSIDGTAPTDQVLSFTGAVAGASVQTGTPLTINVSNNQLFVMPDLANSTPGDAVARLKQATWGGNIGTLGQRYSPSTDGGLLGLIAMGTVPVTGGDQQLTQLPAQTPAANATVNKSVGVTVVVYQAAKVPVPSFTPGVTLLPEIQAQMTSAGFSPDTVTYVTNTTRTPTVPPYVPHSFISLSGAAAGDSVAFNTPITITVWGDAPPKPTPTPTPPTSPPATPPSTPGSTPPAATTTPASAPRQSR